MRQGLLGPSRISAITLSILLAMGAAAPLHGQAGTPDRRAFCEAYASRAEADIQEKERLACRGLGGPRWTSNYAGHFNWCLTANMGNLEIELRGRYDALRRCRGETSVGHPAKHPFCDAYALTAVEQHRVNQQRLCGGADGRWQPNYQGHYDWCMRVRESDAVNNTRHRNEVLARCLKTEERHRTCDRHALDGLANQQENLWRRCGYTGELWAPDFQIHYAWCMQVPPGRELDRTRARNQALATCRAAITFGVKPAQPAEDPSCDEYAHTAVAQNEENLQRSCGFAGVRWSSHYDGHYGWCMRNPEQNAAAETRTRADALARCRQSGTGAGTTPPGTSPPTTSPPGTTPPRTTPPEPPSDPRVSVPPVPPGGPPDDPSMPASPVATSGEIALWGACIQSVLDCLGERGRTITECVAASSCTRECRLRFAAHAGGESDVGRLLEVFDGVFINPGAPCVPAGLESSS